MVRFNRDVLGFKIKEGENAINVYLIKDDTLFMLYDWKNFEEVDAEYGGSGRIAGGHRACDPDGTG